eukprot:jgi/Chrzof1/5075/Cz15g10250.t1
MFSVQLPQRTAQLHMQHTTPSAFCKPPVVSTNHPVLIMLTSNIIVMAPSTAAGATCRPPVPAVRDHTGAC